MKNKDRGEQIRKRLAAQGLASDRAAEAAWADEDVVGRDTLRKIYDGTAAVRSYAKVEAWLDRLETGAGLDAPVPVPEDSLIRVTFSDVTTSSIGEIVAEIPSGQPDEAIAAIAKLIEQVRKGGEQ